MYDELVKRLREAAGPAIDYPDTLYDDAADAIEELSRRVEAEIELEECWHRLENRPLPDIPEPPKEES